MNPYLLYALLLLASSTLYLPVVYFLGRKSIIGKISVFFLPSLATIAYTSFVFGLTMNLWLFVPAIGSLFATVWIIHLLIKKPLKKIQTMISLFAEGNLAEIAEIEMHKKTDEFQIIGLDLKQTCEQISNIINQIRVISEEVLDSGNQLSANSTSLSDAATLQASNIEEISANLEEITSILNQSKENAAIVEQKAREVSENVLQVAEQTENSSKFINEIYSSSSIINEVAINTKILSLNARIEASKAHEFGLGFSVVANEVKSLAEYIEEIAIKITDISKSTVEISNQSNAFMLKTTPKVEETTTMVQNIYVNSVEQAAGVQQISVAMQKLNEITQENSASSEELNASARQLYTNANALNQHLAFFKIK